MNDKLVSCQRLKAKDFMVKPEDLTRKKKGKRQYLNNQLTREVMKELNEFFESYVKIPRMKVGKKQTIETFINEEIMIFAKFLREEQEVWKQRFTETS
jgi:hypothetical protein